MDIIRFLNPVSDTKFEQAEIVNGFKRKLWIERYRDEGEFTLVCQIDKGIREKLPIGSFISHVNTPEVMIVENHELNDKKGKPTEVTITGRSFETYFEQRVVGSNKNYLTLTPSEYVLPADETWNQAVQLIGDHILASALVNDDDSLPYVSVATNLSGAGVSEERAIKTGSLYDNIIDLLGVDDLGVRIFRPGPWSPLGAASPNLLVQVHKGVDRSSEIIFSYTSGEIESADYLWSNKNLKNAALVTGKWIEVVVTPPSSVNYDRRWMWVDGSDIDESYDAAPVGGDIVIVASKMRQRGLQALAAQTDIALTKAELSRQAVRAKYRIDYDVGDTITVEGDYNETSTMRVSEYVEIEDEQGSREYPTLSMIG